MSPSWGAPAPAHGATARWAYAPRSLLFFFRLRRFKAVELCSTPRKLLKKFDQTFTRFAVLFFYRRAAATKASKILRLFSCSGGKLRVHCTARANRCSGRYTASTMPSGAVAATSRPFPNRRMPW